MKIQTHLTPIFIWFAIIKGELVDFKMNSLDIQLQAVFEKSDRYLSVTLNIQIFNPRADRQKRTLE